MILTVECKRRQSLMSGVPRWSNWVLGMSGIRRRNFATFPPRETERNGSSARCVDVLPVAGGVNREDIVIGEHAEA